MQGLQIELCVMKTEIEKKVEDIGDKIISNASNYRLPLESHEVREMPELQEMLGDEWTIRVTYKHLTHCIDGRIYYVNKVKRLVIYHPKLENQYIIEYDDNLKNNLGYRVGGYRRYYQSGEYLFE